MSYPNDLKRKIVLEFLRTPDLSRRAISKRYNIPRKTISEWIAKYSGFAMGNKNIEKKDTNWTSEEKFNAVMKYTGLSEIDKGVFLRANGLHSTDIENWKSEMLGGFKLAKKVKHLEDVIVDMNYHDKGSKKNRELHHKEKDN